MKHRRDFHSLKSPSVIIIPMIDIMLFLLVFFMISTIYMVQLNTLPVNLPAAAAVQRETRPAIISVTVTKDGNVFYDKDQKPSLILSPRIRQDLAKNKETIFVIRGDRKTSYEAITRVLDTLKQSGAKHVSLATEDKNAN
ncbi:MAG: biopolymer transporter ExbD [Acidaminococcaceae bacterium]|nr:biopolymer transporter ExbD [Acidaminococcaceae bacterium]MBQ9635755.1 biopolymer transporter ExbD [Acidaminococcaceae bacterium]MBQ9698330.1 biopolymer transporter ExbD [Acidaminococcaceae bacterium]MBR1590428.1 biopolymer transporter ExbD [Acidaminococcaceae bacterium]